MNEELHFLSSLRSQKPFAIRILIGDMRDAIFFILRAQNFLNCL